MCGRFGLCSLDICALPLPTTPYSLSLSVPRRDAGRLFSPLTWLGITAPLLPMFPIQNNAGLEQLTVAAAASPLLASVCLRHCSGPDIVHCRHMTLSTLLMVFYRHTISSTHLAVLCRHKVLSASVLVLCGYAAPNYSDVAAGLFSLAGSADRKHLLQKEAGSWQS